MPATLQFAALSANIACDICGTNDVQAEVFVALFPIPTTSPIAERWSFNAAVTRALEVGGQWGRA